MTINVDVDPRPDAVGFAIYLRGESDILRECKTPAGKNQDNKLFYIHNLRSLNLKKSTKGFK